MKLFNISSLAILALTSSTAYAGCYTGGEVGDQASANAKIGDICAQGVLGGTYSTDQVKSYCLPLGSVRYNFYIYNIRGNTNFMNSDGCVEYMKREISCQYGGDRSYSAEGWRFIADPNRGSC